MSYNFSFHITSSHLISCHFTFPHYTISFYLVSSHITSLLSYHRISRTQFNITSYRFCHLLCLMSSRIHLCHVMSSHFTSWYLTSPFVCLLVASCHPTSPYVILFRHVMSHHLISSHLISTPLCSSVIAHNHAFPFFLEGTYSILHYHTSYEA